MSVAERTLGMMDDFGYVLTQAQGGNYAEALRLLAKAKAADPRNIFLIALEKQISRLRSGGMLPREKMEVLQSLPGLVERARADSQKRGVKPADVQAPHAEVRDEKHEKFRLVVDQYFQHADEWLAKGELESAMKEIERVLLIEPGNLKARKYREEIEAALRTFPAEEPPAEREAVPAPQPVTREFGEETESAAPAQETALAQAEPDAGSAEKKRRVLTVAVLAVIALAAIAVGVFTFVLPGKTTIPATESAMPPPEMQPVGDAPPEGGAEIPARRERVEETPEVVPPPAASARRKKEPEPVQTAPATIPIEDARPPLQQATPAALAAKKSDPAPGASTGFIAVQRDPKILKLATPVFPEADQYGDLSGQVVVKVQIDTKGKPLQALIVSSTNNTLNKPVVDAVMRSSFEPAMMSSGPVVSWMTIPIRMK